MMIVHTGSNAVLRLDLYVVYVLCCEIERFFHPTEINILLGGGGAGGTGGITKTGFGTGCGNLRVG